MARRRKTESLGDGLGRAFTKRGPKVELDFLLPTHGPSAGAEPTLEPAPAAFDVPVPEAPIVAPIVEAPIVEAPIVEIPIVEAPAVRQHPVIVWPSLEASAPRYPVPPAEPVVEVTTPTWSAPRWTPAAPPHPTRWRDRALRHVERLVSRVLRAVF